MRLLWMLVLLGLGVGGFFLWLTLDAYFSTSALVTSINLPGQTISQGWEIVLAIWPVAFVGVFLGSGISLLVLPWLVRHFIDADQHLKINRLKKKLEQAEVRIESADQIAESRLAVKIEVHEELSRDLDKAQFAAVAELDKAEKLQAKARAQIARVKKRESEFEQRALDAEKRRDNAMHAANRHKRSKKSSEVKGPKPGLA